MTLGDVSYNYMDHTRSIDSIKDQIFRDIIYHEINIENKMLV